MFYFRRLLPGGDGREVTLSLGTRHYREAEHLAELLALRFAACMDDAAEAGKAPPDIAGILRSYRNSLLETERDMRVAAPSGRRSFVASPEAAAARAEDAGLSPEEADLEQLEMLLGDAGDNLRDRNTRSEMATATALMAEHRVPEAWRPEMLLGLLEVRVEVLAEMIRSRERAMRSLEPMVLLPEEPGQAVAGPLRPAGVVSAPPESPEAPLLSTFTEPFFGSPGRKETRDQVCLRAGRRRRRCRSRPFAGPAALMACCHVVPSGG